MRQTETLKLIQDATTWAKQQPDISGVLLVGSYAREATRPDSDVDLMLFTSSITPWIENQKWLKTFGEVENVTFEDWNAVKSLRVLFAGGPEVEFSFATPAWTSVSPIDPGTLRVVADGVKILFDPDGFLARLVVEVRKSKVKF